MSEDETGDLPRIDADESAETGDTRIRVKRGDHDTFQITRERYGLVKHVSRQWGIIEEHDDADEEPRQEYDWYVDECFTLRSSQEAEQVAVFLAGEDAFDPTVTFCSAFWGADKPDGCCDCDCDTESE